MKNLIILSGIMVAMSLFVSQAYATGCPVDAIIPFLDDAISSFNSGDYATALSQIQEAKNQLEDTFEADE